MASSFVTCSYCSKDFLKDNSHINENIKLHNNFYCSSTCQSSFKNKQVELICESPHCNKRFRRSPKEKSFRNFCSSICAMKIIGPENGLKHKKYHYCQYCGNKISYGTIYCSRQCWGKDHEISKKQLIEQILKLSKILGRTPTRRECTYSSSASKHFGSWSNALVASGLVPHRSLNQRMYKRRLCIAIDGHICNSVSELLIDNWLSIKAIDHQKETPYPKGKFTADWSLSKNTFVEYFGLANDSRRYDAEIKKKQQICKDSGIFLIEIYSQHLFPKNNLNQLFHRRS